MTDTGAFLRATRKAAGLTQRELAERAFTAQSAVSRIEQNRASPSIRSLAALIEAAGRELVLRAE